MRPFRKWKKLNLQIIGKTFHKWKKLNLQVKGKTFHKWKKKHFPPGYFNI